MMGAFVREVGVLQWKQTHQVSTEDQRHACFDCELYQVLRVRPVQHPCARAGRASAQSEAVHQPRDDLLVTVEREDRIRGELVT